MPIDLFDPAVQKSNPARSSSDDIVGRFRSGYQINKRPAALTEWRVTTGDPEIADAVHALLGGKAPEEWETTTEENLEVFTDAASIDIILGGPSAVDARMLIWPRGQKRIVVCDGSIFETEGKPYECEIGGFTNKREHDEQEHICDPRVSITFRLAERPDLGIFRFESGAWSLATAVSKPIGDLMKIDGPARATLALEKVEMKDGKSFTKPVLKIVGAYDGEV